ncbi:MAG: hypothetical protein KBB88_02770 [Candidatus Pacebacteria bacterium]|nr:hypothetical protein [Candidatus Paceibacterota bacterium]
MHTLSTQPTAQETQQDTARKENILRREKWRTLILLCILGLALYFYHELNRLYDANFSEAIPVEIQR